MSDDEAIQLLLDLLSIPSVTGSEDEAIGFLTETFRQQGLRAEVDAAGNSIGSTGNGERKLTFLGHVDTVSGDVPVRIEDDRISGRGAVDAKGPLAAAVVAASRCRHVPGLEIIAAVGEEGPSNGARFLAKQTPPAALVIGEPGGSDSIVLGYKGSIRASIQLAVPASHSAGQSSTASDQAVDVWLAVRHACRTLSPAGPTFDQLTPTLLGFESASDGLSQAATLRASLRVPPGMQFDMVRKTVAEAAAPATTTFEDGEPPFRASKTTPIVASFVRSIREEGAQPRFKVKTGTSDMNVVGPVWQCPTLAYGPGDSAMDHTPNEHIHVDEYLRGIRVLSRVFGEWVAT